MNRVETSRKLSKGRWWMPRQREAMKGVAGCDKPRGAAEQALIRGFPNGATHRAGGAVSVSEPSRRRRRTRGSEASQYPEEKKSTEIPQVAASERGRAQTIGVPKAAPVAPVGL